MKKLNLIICFFVLAWSSLAQAENIEQRLTAIEKKLEKIEKSLEALGLLNPLLSNTSNQKDDLEQRSVDNKKAIECVKIQDQKFDIIQDMRDNEFFPAVEISWKIDYKNSCDVTVIGNPIMKILDKDGLILDQDNVYNFYIRPNTISTAKGKIYMTGVNKINRMYSSSAGLKKPLLAK